MLDWLRRILGRPTAAADPAGELQRERMPDAEDATARARHLAEVEHGRRHVEDDALAMGEKRRMIF
jgi:hypothetical protein